MHMCMYMCMYMRMYMYMYMYMSVRPSSLVVTWTPPVLRVPRVSIAARATRLVVVGRVVGDAGTLVNYVGL